MESRSLSLKEIGVDVEDVIARLGGNEKAYLSICGKFRSDRNFQLFQTAIEAGDLKKAILHIHTLKGIASNLGFNRFAQVSSSILEALRKNDQEALRLKVKELTEEYNKVIGALSS